MTMCVKWFAREIDGRSMRTRCQLKNLHFIVLMCIDVYCCIWPEMKKSDEYFINCSIV